MKTKTSPKKKSYTSALDVKTHAIACQVLNIDPKKVTGVHEQLDNIAKAMNKLDKFKPSFKNGDQQKWYPWFYVNASGFRFGDSLFVYSVSDANAGSRLCFRFRTEDISNFFANQHFALHKKAFYK